MEIQTLKTEKNHSAMPAMQTLDKIAIAMPHAVTISISGRNRKISYTKAHTEKTGGGEGDNQLHGQQEICYSIFFPPSSVFRRKLPFSITTLILIRRQVVVEDDRLDKNGRWRRRRSDGGNDESDDKLDLRLMVPTSF